MVMARGLTELTTVDNVRLQLFGKAKLGLEMLPQINDALEFPNALSKFEATVWLQAFTVIVNDLQIKNRGCLSSTHTSFYMP